MPIPLKSKPKLRKQMIRFREGDSQLIKEYFPALSFNKVVRTLVSNLVDKLRAQTVPNTEIEALVEEAQLAGDE